MVAVAPQNTVVPRHALIMPWWLRVLVSILVTSYVLGKPTFNLVQIYAAARAPDAQMAALAGLGAPGVIFAITVLYAFWHSDKTFMDVVLDSAGVPTLLIGGIGIVGHL